MLPQSHRLSIIVHRFDTHHLPQSRFIAPTSLLTHCLCQQRLLLSFRHLGLCAPFMRRLCRWSSCRRAREILFLHTRRLCTHISLLDRRLLRTANHLLRLARVVFDRALTSLHRLVGVLGRQIAHLRGLLVDQVLGVGDVGVDQLAVLDVGQREEVGEGGEEEGQTPGRRDLDQEVGYQCCRKGLPKTMSVVIRMRSLDCGLTATVTPMFSANTTRWNSITKKFASSVTSSITLSSVSRGMV